MSAATPLVLVSGDASEYGADVDEFDQQPDPQWDDTCERCGEHGCVAIAHVSWVLADGTRDHLRVGRACIAPMVEEAREYRFEGGRIHVDYPTWRASVAATAAGVSYRMLDHWLRRGYITAVGEAYPGSGHQRSFRFDAVHHARWLGRFAVLGVLPWKANELLTERPEQVESAYVALGGVV